MPILFFKFPLPHLGFLALTALTRGLPFTFLFLLYSSGFFSFAIIRSSSFMPSSLAAASVVPIVTSVVDKVVTLKRLINVGGLWGA